MSLPNKRRDTDVMKLMMNDYVVETINDSINELSVEFHGPKESLYEGRVWKVSVKLPDTYPYNTPKIKFINKIYHPNINEKSGFVCLDVINQSWSPMFDLLNVFEVFLPQLLLYPNPSHPLNREAASLMIKDPKQYDQKVKGGLLHRIQYCECYAKKADITTETSEEEISDEDVSDDESAESQEDDTPGLSDP